MKRLASLVIVPCLVAGCGSAEHEDLRVWMKEAASDLRPGVPPLPSVKPYEPVAYAAAGVPDPFNAVRVKGGAESRAGKGNAPDLSRPREPLEDFPLETMTLVGVMRDKSRVVGQVLVNGKSYEVKVGNYLGQNFGKVVRVDTTKDEEKLVLKELVQEADGAWVERQSELQLAGRGSLK